MRAKAIAWCYKTLLKLFKLNKDYRGGSRTKIGMNPYPRRSPFLLALFNFQELFRFLKSSRKYLGFRKDTLLLKDSKVGRVALLLGNGPSLDRLIPSKVSISNPDIWVVNSFYRLEFSDELDVSYYVLSDHDNLESGDSTLQAQFQEILEFGRKKKVTYVLPHWAKGTRQFNLFSENPTVFFDDRDLSSWTRNTSPLKPRGYLSLTLYKALAFALHLGYEKIYILGMDNSEFITWHSDAKNRLFNGGNYSYEIESDSGQDFTSEQPDGLAGAFVSYAHAFADLARFQGPILNLDEHSLTTAFPKVIGHPWVRIKS